MFESVKNMYLKCNIEQIEILHVLSSYIYIYYFLYALYSVPNIYEKCSVCFLILAVKQMDVLHSY
jgi:hypothetical protein